VDDARANRKQTSFITHRPIYLARETIKRRNTVIAPSLYSAVPGRRDRNVPARDR
jgi:hypothetical protein